MMNKNHKSFVCGLKGKYLSKDEVEKIYKDLKIDPKKPNPWQI